MKNYLCVVFLILQTAAPGVFSFPENSRNEILHDLKSIGEGHIVGGEEVEPHSHPHQVGLLLNPDIDHGFCGGSLLSNVWVVTAAHCTNFSYINDIGIIVGAHRIKEHEDGVQILPVDRVFPHPEYDKSVFLNDISLIRLAVPATLSNFVQPIRLPSEAQKNWSFWNSKVTLTGWGYDSDKSSIVSPVLRGVETRVVTNFYCTLRYFFQLVYSSNICASGWFAKGTCNGDSGGPMVLKESDGIHTLIGVSSFGVGYGCEKSWPVVFTRITSHLDWIHNITHIPKRN